METIYFRFIDFIGESKGFRFGSVTVVLFVLRKKAIVIVRAFIHQRGKKSKHIKKQTSGNSPSGRLAVALYDR